MKSGDRNRGAGVYSQSHPKITRDRSVNAAGNPTSKPKQALPKDVVAPVSPSYSGPGMSGIVSGVGGSRTITRGPIKKYYT
jgi:hypothetical protein